jgi:ubiquinone/menaquinone biosynthesis C-methylase UbiE
MEPYEYATLYQFENNYWWYRALHAVLKDQVLRLIGPQTGCVLDAGCGTGQNLISLSRVLDARLFAFDYSSHAVPFLKTRGVANVCRASVNEVPYPSNTFDLVMCIDVLESQGVNVKQALASLCRVVKPGGHLLLVVPAYELLKSPEHHQAVHADKRFTLNSFAQNSVGLPLKTLRQTYFFTLLFPAIAVYRLWQRIFPSKNAQARSELHALPGWINTLLFLMMKIEIALLGRIDFRFGSSILLYYQKEPV